MFKVINEQTQEIRGQFSNEAAAIMKADTLLFEEMQVYIVSRV